MTRRVRLSAVVALVVVAAPAWGSDEGPRLAADAHAVLKTRCYRCHGQDGSTEGGLNYVADLAKLVARKKVVPGDPGKSRLFKRIEEGSMPPPGEPEQLTAAEVEQIRRWIAAGAPAATPAMARPRLTSADVYQAVLADLEPMDRRARRFQRYFTLTHLYNAGLSADELQTYRNALNKLVNSLSWGSKIVNPVPVDAAGTVFRIDLRWYQWDAATWNRILQEYPYGVLEDTTVARAVAVATLTKVPVVRADWFVATASRAPLYYDVLQLPASLTEVERLLRVDAVANIRQERVVRAAFTGSGVSRFNRVLERHDAAHGMYWRTYDFDEPPANLADRLGGNLVPDPRNVFAFPLGPAGLAEFPFRHAGGEAIFTLPNGLHGYYIADGVNGRLNKAPVAIVSDPKRPDRAVEAGVSCMSCHTTGILPKADQMRDHLEKNPKAFTRAEAELIRALYPGKEAVLKLMEEDARRYAEAVARTGAKVSKSEAVGTITQRYEADLDLELAAAEAGLTPDAFRQAVARSETLRRHFGGLLTPGGTVGRQIWVQAFGDLTRELNLGTLFVASLNGPSNPDGTGELDPLEARDGTAHQMAFTSDGTRAVVAAADRSVRVWDVIGRRDLKRLVGHTASVWAVALSADGRLAISGGMDGTARVWDVTRGSELRAYTEHAGLVSAVGLSPDGRWGLSAGFDGVVAAWKVASGEEVWRVEGLGTVTALAVDPSGNFVVVGVGRTVRLLELASGRELRSHGPFPAAVAGLAISPDGTWYAAGCDDGTTRLWKTGEDQPTVVLAGHTGPVRSLALRDSGRWVLTAGADHTVRLWDTTRPAEAVAVFRQHRAPVVAAAFLANGTQTLSGDRNLTVLPWSIDRFLSAPSRPTPPPTLPDRIPYAEP